MTLLDEARVHLEALGAANRAFMQVYTGDRASRQPVHTVYGGAQLFKAETTSRLGAVARATLDTYGRTPADFKSLMKEAARLFRDQKRDVVFLQDDAAQPG